MPSVWLYCEPATDSWYIRLISCHFSDFSGYFSSLMSSRLNFETVLTADAWSPKMSKTSYSTIWKILKHSFTLHNSRCQRRTFRVEEWAIRLTQTFSVVPEKCFFLNVISSYCFYSTHSSAGALFVLHTDTRELTSASTVLHVWQRFSLDK